MGDSSGVELELRWVLPSPFSEVFHAFETFAGLRELKHGVVVVNLVGNVFVFA